MTPRFRKVTLLIIAAALSPLTLLTALLAVSTINPMGIAFLTEFTVVNESAGDIWVTPIGAIGKEGRRATLPYSRFKHLYVLSAEDRDFHIASRSGRTFVYDWDDIQFSEVLVRTNEGAFRVMLTGLHPTEGRYRTPQQNRFIISDFGSLDVAGPVHLGALEADRRQRVRILHGLAIGGLLPLVLFFVAFRRRR